ncbi:MAG: hypothetical protein ACYTG6_10280, partial [Planctomycetota bacterium]
MSYRMVAVALVSCVSLGVVGCGSEAEDGGADPKGAVLTVSEARTLLAEATRCSPYLVSAARSLGRRLLLRDLENAPGGAGAALLYLADQGFVDEAELRVLAESLGDALGAMIPGGVTDADAVGEDVVVSLLRDPFLVNVTIEDQRSGAASGVATFLALDAYEGRFRYEAEHDGTAWRIAELSLPASEIRVTFAGEEWELHLPPPLRSINPLRAG